MKRRAACGSLVLVALLAALTFASAPVRAQPETFRPKLVVVTYFAAETRNWIERDALTRTIAVPGMSYAVRANADGSEVAIAVGPGQIRPAVNLMALAADPRFDLRTSYWLINGIAGVSPHDAPLGSAFWTDYVVNGELLHMLDAREIPAGWADGFVAVGKSLPTEPDVAAGSPDDVRTWPAAGAHIDSRGTVVRLNPRLLRWAFARTRDMRLPFTPAMRAAGARFRDDPAAARVPRVGVGANLATEDFWHGAKLDAWAHRWVPFMTGGRARFATTAENDSGALVALYSLSRSGRVDWNRALLLRTCSNFDMQDDGETAAQSLAAMWHGGFPAFAPSLDAAYLVGHRVAVAILAGNAARP